MRFALERLLVRGPIYKVLVILAGLLLLSVTGGLAVVALPAAEFEGAGEAIWWAFLRLTDPGYLADDRGPGIVLVASILTVLGLAVFVGALVAVLTQWLDATIERLQLGLTPVTCQGHTAILGWTNRTVELVAELAEAGQVSRSAPVVVLVQRVDPEHRVELRGRLGKRYSDRAVILRTGDPRQLEHLDRVNCREAATVVVPGRDFGPGGPETRDPETLKVLATLDAHVADAESRPRVASELFDPLLVPVGERAYHGDVEVVASDEIAGRVLALETRSVGLSAALVDMLDARDGRTVFQRAAGDLAGVTIDEAVARIQNCVMLGTLRDREFSADGERRVEASDRLVLLGSVADPLEVSSAPSVAGEIRPPISVTVARRVLVLGWSGKAPDLLLQLARQPYVRYEVDVVSRRSADEREAELRRDQGEVPALPIRQLEGDVTSLRRMTELDLASYDRVILLATDKAASSEAADARTIAALLVLNEVSGTDSIATSAVVELLDPANAPMVEQHGARSLCTPLLLARVLAGWATYPGLAFVLKLMLGRARSSAAVVPVSDFGAEARSFGDLDQLARARGEIALGVQAGATGEVLLAPPKSQEFSRSTGDQVIVVRRGSA